MSEFVETLRLTPALFPIEGVGNGRSVRLVRLDEAAYRRASFLDGRLITPEVESLWIDWPTLEAAAQVQSIRAHFIFHVGHVGSTLLSRLMGEHRGLFSLREPALLRDVASGALTGRLHALLALFSRTWRPEQTALIKATSFVSEIAPELLAQTPGSRAILLTATPPAYLRSILGGDASCQEAQALAPLRQRRLERRLGSAVQAASLGEQIAMNWLCEATALAALADLHPERVLWLDFDRLLADPVTLLSKAFRHLDADASALDLRGLVEGPIMRQYAKGPEHAYDAALRQSVQAEAERTFGGEVRSGMTWLQRTAEAHPQLRGPLQRAATAARPPLAAGPEAS